jgi:hypothetical protein
VIGADIGCCCKCNPTEVGHPDSSYCYDLYLYYFKFTVCSIEQVDGHLAQIIPDLIQCRTYGSVLTLDIAVNETPLRLAILTAAAILKQLYFICYAVLNRSKGHG